MWSSPQTQEPIEKIRKAQWTPENTSKTQKVVDELEKARQALAYTYDRETVLQVMLKRAMKRFKELDGAINLPARLE